MLKSSRSFSSFSVDNIEVAQKFYTETLGLTVNTIPEGLDLKLEGNSVFIYPKPNHEPATFTVLNFLVDDIENVVDSLTAQGISFEQYDYDQMKTNEKGIAELGPRSMAWFKDPAGNFLALIQEK
jgi:catechol 2,3-dioxygenase-like lactoylglutathione lyase family enzyme